MSKEFGETAEIVFERLLVERNAGEPQEIIFEVVQVPRNGLAIKARARIADLVVQIPSGLDLKARQNLHRLPIRLDNFGRNIGSVAIG